MTPLISIVVPVYDVEEYIHKCIDSIINQTYSNIEIVLVNDGSPDNCPKICEEYKKNDKRIKVIHKNNGGLSDARNYGLGVCSGDYILFVDSDDYLELNACEILVEYLKQYAVDLIVFKHREVIENENKKYTDSNKILIMDRNKAYCNYLYGNHLYHSVWSKLYRKTLFDDIKFPLGKTAEDLAITYKLIMKCDNIIYIDKTLYNYRIRKNSIMQSNSINLIIDAYKFNCEKYEFERKTFPEYHTQSQSLYLNSILRTICRVSNNVDYIDILNDCEKRIKKIDTKSLTLKSKIAYYIYNINLKLFILIMSKLKII